MFKKKIVEVFRYICRVTLGALFGWLLAFVEVVRRLCRLRHQRTLPVRPKCIPLPARVYKRPDPLIYCQYDLMAHGIAVTWDNPDIQLRKGGVDVSSDGLALDTEYEVVARIWNGSSDAPAVDMPVVFSYLTFGIGTQKIPIGETRLDLAAKGLAGCPAFAFMPWRTPSIPGHYCLQVELLWGDDSNPHNNLGQENTNVGKFNSPTATFKFPVRNEADGHRTIELKADAYRIPERPPCPLPRTKGSGGRDGDRLAPNARERRTLRDAAYLALSASQAKDAFPIKDGWVVTIAPDRIHLPARDTAEVTVVITAPYDDFPDKGIFNVNAFEGTRLLGGVTLTAEK
jgi:hypothetical protein